MHRTGIGCQTEASACRKRRGPTRRKMAGVHHSSRFQSARGVPRHLPLSVATTSTTAFGRLFPAARCPAPCPVPCLQPAFDAFGIPGTLSRADQRNPAGHPRTHALGCGTLAHRSTRGWRRTPSLLAATKAAAYPTTQGYTVPDWSPAPPAQQDEPADFLRGWHGGCCRPRLALPCLGACMCVRLYVLLSARAAAPAAAHLMRRETTEPAPHPACSPYPSNTPSGLNVALSAMNIDAPVHDARHIDIVFNGLPVRHGAQLAVDATLVSSVTCPLWARSRPSLG